MEKLMLTHLTVTDDDLRALAQQRADEVKNQLTKSGVPGERLFVVEAKTLAAETKEELKRSRVDFTLR
jgi:outer membrane protein OmpA-like peptidoglycan-associated protein